MGLSLVGGFFNGLSNVQAAENEKRMRDQDRFSQLAMNSISEYKTQMSTVKKQHAELNNMGKQLVAAGVEPEKIDYALSLPYAQAVKLMSDPEALRNISVKPRQAPTPQPTAPGLGAPQAPAAPAGSPAPQPAAPAGMGGPTPMAAPQGAPAAPTGPAGVQTYGTVEGTADPLADMRGSIEALAKNAGWSPKMMQQFQQAIGANQNVGVYKFANPETAGQLIFKDPKQAERIIKANDAAMDRVMQFAANMDPTMPPQQRIQTLSKVFGDTYSGVAGGSMEGAVMPSPELFGQLMDPAYARTLLAQKTEERQQKEKIDAFVAEYIRQGMKPEEAAVRGRAAAMGMSQQTPTPVDPNPGFNQITGIVGSQFKGEIIPDPVTGQLRVNIVDPVPRADFMFANTMAQEIYREALNKAGSRGAAISPAEAGRMGMEVLSASKTMLTNATAKAQNNREAATALIQAEIKNEMAKGEGANQNRLRALQGAMILNQAYAESANAPAAPPAAPPATKPKTAAAAPRGRVAAEMPMPTMSQ